MDLSLIDGMIHLDEMALTVFFEHVETTHRQPA